MIVLLEIVLPSIAGATVAAKLKNTVPCWVLVPAPLIVQFVTVLFFASETKRMVWAEPVKGLSRVRELPPVFNPSIVTLVAPSKLIKAPEIVPETVRAPPPEGVHGSLKCKRPNLSRWR